MYTQIMACVLSVVVTDCAASRMDYFYGAFSSPLEIQQISLRSVALYEEEQYENSAKLIWARQSKWKNWTYTA